ncbi:EAL domain-containing protein [Aestuariirhabdus sp. Z084]|uniref:putative bifunctional diguanylate cyclase/phosphodiesterase n=1 Tax=Aestuariirhabdus haliotis TaxID=2918751 RepID=UPI00201B3FED|nr:EAL domain-containing protein [Aestuariirhabdus haliotis]MCL6416813.1 EAL domain-containing protein [Aestuariirhabdus haliotis]MCL6420813.1 EAL domain-containing protein [Aestuariirhabdus haliotis]
MPKRGPLSPLLIEVVIASCIALSVFFVFILFDLNEQWYALTRQYEDYELDELTGLVVGALLGLLFVSICLLRRSLIDRSSILTLSRDMEYQAYTDHLTQLPNRRALDKMTRSLIAQSSSRKNAFTLMSIDLDSFKFINDTLGHSTGDKLLKAVSDRFSKVTPESSMVFRIGGDEFCVLLPGQTSNEQCLQICDELNAHITDPFCIDGQKLHISQTIGISRYPEDGNTFEQLLKIADIAMYMGKSPGQGRNNFMDRDFIRDMKRRFIVQHGLNDAVTKNELFVEYQPKVALGSEELVGSEALVRWRHPEHGLIPPNEFIYIAEESHAVRSIDFFVLESVCKQIKSWGQGAKPVAVNLSPLLFADANLATDIMSVIRKHDISPSLIELEITERTIVADSDIPMRICKALTEQGVKLSLDDFGTGYSSLSHLADFPISAVKIDRAFIRRICHHDRTRNIVAAVIGLAAALDIRVIAEGVETATQHSLVGSMGCDEAQGYYFGRPMANGDFTHRLLHGSLQPAEI